MPIKLFKKKKKKNKMHETPKVIRKVSIIQLIIQNQTMPYEKL